MIKLENVVLASPEQMKFIIEGMRNPMNSWEKSDTCFSDESCVNCYYNQRNLCDKDSFFRKVERMMVTRGISNTQPKMMNMVRQRLT